VFMPNAMSDFLWVSLSVSKLRCGTQDPGSLGM